MFKSLLQTIPTISGNFTLACKLDNYTQNMYNEYTSYISDAILMSLDNNYSLTKDIKINLINSKYEYDVIKYFKEMSANFYNDTYLKNTNIFESYQNNTLLPDNRDKNFEFGCKRISYNKYQYQYQFFAPIYINNIDDMPDEFVIEIHSKNSLLKKIHIPIGINSSKNKLRIYLNKFISKIENNTPVVWNFNDNKIIYKNAIDCKNGGLITLTSYNTIDSKNVYQTIINDIDNLICDNYKQNNIILSECIPLSFIFNINDILEDNDYKDYYFNQFNILGYYTKNNLKCKYYTFSTNYHHNYNIYNVFNNVICNFDNQKYNLFDNNIIYSLKEGTNYKLYYQNTFKNVYCQWKLLESNSYIININSVFTYNKLENKFPIFKNTFKNKPKALFDDNTLYLPINNYVNIYEENDQNQYNLLVNNNYNNWFKIYNENIDKNDLFKICNNYVLINGIRYYINDNSFKYFGIFINPIIDEYNPNIIVGDTILEKHKDNSGFDYYEYIDENNQYYEEYTDNIDNLNNNDIVYIKYDNEIKYTEYNDELVNNLSNDNIFENYILQNFSKSNILLERIFYPTINKYTNINNIYRNVFNTYFDIKEGYLKLDNIYLDDFSESKILNIFYKNKDLRDMIYYSLPNTKEKNNLYYDLYKNIINYDYLINNNVSLFVKKSFIEINNINKFNINIFGENGLFTNIKNKYYINTEKIDNKQYILNNIIDNISLNKSNIKNIDLWLNVSDLINLFNLLDNNDISNISFKELIYNNFIYDLTHLMIYIMLYNKLNNVNNIDLFRYIPYYNDNNININYEYYEQLYNNVDYLNLYTNIKLDNSTSEFYKYILIDNIDIFNYYLNSGDVNEKNFYHLNYVINDDLTKSYELIELSEYINSYIINKILIDDNCLNPNSFYIQNNNVTVNELITLLNNDKYEDLLQLLKHNIKFVNNNFVLELFYNFNDEDIKKYTIPINLYFYTKMYNINSSMDNYNSYINPLIIYKELPIIEKNNLVSIIYNDFSSNKKHNFKYQQLLKNIDKINDIYVYKNPYNYFIKLTVNNYIKDYDKKIKIYRKLDNLNTFDIEYKTNDQYAYIILNYHMMLSTNLFNLYNIDYNDNFEIKKINNIVLNNENVKELFKLFYPYLKQDILLNLIVQLNNDNNIPINIILPSNIKCNINTIVNKKQDNKKFTNISLTNNILQILYLNRYFGNIDPYFIEINNSINNMRSKIYIINDSLQNNINCDNNNVYIENVNIYKYNEIPYYKNINNSNLFFVKQYEYKHFNNNYLFNLPNELNIIPNDINYIDKTKLSEYVNKDKCYVYFKQYLINNFNNYDLISNENLFLYIFSKYNIEYIQQPNGNIGFNKIYKITYKLTLI